MKSKAKNKSGFVMLRHADAINFHEAHPWATLVDYYIFRRVQDLNKAGLPCTMSNESLAKECMCSVGCIRKRILKMADEGILNVKSVKGSTLREMWVSTSSQKGQDDATPTTEKGQDDATISSQKGQDDALIGNPSCPKSEILMPSDSNNKINKNISDNINKTSDNINKTNDNINKTNENINNISISYTSCDTNTNHSLDNSKNCIDDWKSDLERLQKERDEKEAAFWAEFDKPWSDDMRDNWEEDLERIKQERAKASAAQVDDNWQYEDVWA